MGLYIGYGTMRKGPCDGVTDRLMHCFLPMNVCLRKFIERPHSGGYLTAYNTSLCLYLPSVVDPFSLLLAAGGSCSGLTAWFVIIVYSSTRSGTSQRIVRSRVKHRALILPCSAIEHASLKFSKLWYCMLGLGHSCEDPRCT